MNVDGMGFATEKRVCCLWKMWYNWNRKVPKFGEITLFYSDGGITYLCKKETKK